MIYITGDIHGDVYRFSTGSLEYLEHKFTEEDFIIICGDFGVIWDNSKEQAYDLKWLEEKPFTTLFVTGNHENYDLLEQYPVSEWNGGKIRRINRKVFHLMNGQVFKIDGYTFFTMGGAESHDIRDGILEPDDIDFRQKLKELRVRRALFRVNHISWWKQEIPSREEMDEGVRNLERVGWKVDAVLTHCAPTHINNRFGRLYYPENALTDYLEDISKRLSFRKWFFGHYHSDEILDDRYRLLYDLVVDLNDELQNTDGDIKSDGKLDGGKPCG